MNITNYIIVMDNSEKQMNYKINDKIFEKFPKLESKRLIYREFEKSDALDLFLIKSDDNVMNYMDSPKHHTTQDSEKIILEIQNSFKEKTGINWAIIEKSTNELIGYFGFWRLINKHCRAEIGYALKFDCWGKGVMKETINRLVDFGFNDLKIHSIEANVNPNNEKSKQLLVKLGFKKEAYFRENYLFDNKFIDSVIYSLLETDVR